MTLSAVLVIPHAGPGLPDYLFGPVAGVPLLIRQILGLRRAGIAVLAILIDPAKQAELARRLDRYRSMVGAVRLITDWLDPDVAAAPDPPADYILLLAVNILLGRQAYEALIHQVPPPGGLSIGVLPSSSPLPAPSADGRPPWPSRTAGGVCLFTAAAWQEWLHWLRQNQGDPLGSASGLWTRSAEFVTHKTALGQAAPLALEPSQLIPLGRDEDLTLATARLITLENDSPLSEGILEKAWNRPLARLLLPWILARPWSPNQITLFSFLVGLLVVWGFAHGSYVASVGAGLLLPVILVLDCLDGAVARLKFQESRLGALLDLYGDSVLNLLLFLGMVIGCYRNSGQRFFLVMGVLIIIGYMACWRLLLPSPVDQPAAPQPAAAAPTFGDKLLAEAVSRDFFYIILLMALLGRLDWLVISLAVGTNIFAWLTYRQQRHGQH
jgi:phosphatidylglycerophosphate synthase